MKSASEMLRDPDFDYRSDFYASGWEALVQVVEAAEAGVLALDYADSHGHSPYDGRLDREELFENALKEARASLTALREHLEGGEE